MLELCPFAKARSQKIPQGIGCEPYWQHIARCRELRMVHEMLPPPCGLSPLIEVLNLPL